MRLHFHHERAVGHNDVAAVSASLDPTAAAILNRQLTRRKPVLPGGEVRLGKRGNFEPGKLLERLDHRAGLEHEFGRPGRRIAPRSRNLEGAYFCRILIGRIGRPLEDERLDGAGAVAAVAEAAVEGLHVGEDALPVGLLHLDHVVRVEEGTDVAVLPVKSSFERLQWGKVYCFCLLRDSEGQVKVVSAVPRLELVEVECLGVEAVDEGAEGQAVVPRGREVGHVHILPREIKCIISWNA